MKSTLSQLGKYRILLGAFGIVLLCLAVFSLGAIYGRENPQALLDTPSPGAIPTGESTDPSTRLGYDPESRSVEVLAEGAASLNPILTVPSQTYILSQKVSLDGRYVAFTLATPISYMDANGQIGTVVDATAAFLYDTQSARMPELLFTGYESSQRYPKIQEIGPDAALLAFSLHQCYACDAQAVSSIVVREESTPATFDSLHKDLGPAIDIMFTGSRSYTFARPFTEGLGSLPGTRHEGSF